MTAFGGHRPVARDDAAARARRRLLRELAGNVAAAVAAIRENLSLTPSAPRAALA
jgi:hypothetical protein